MEQLPSQYLELDIQIYLYLVKNMFIEDSNMNAKCMETKLVTLDPDYAQKFINGSFIGHLMIQMRKSVIEKTSKKMTPAEM